MTTFERTTVTELSVRFRADPDAAESVVRVAHQKASEAPPSVFIHRVPLDVMLAELAEARARRDRGESLPLFGVPYALKDAFDVAGTPTTAACPAFSYVAKESAPLV